MVAVVQREQIEVTGVVQGVGFRPFVHTLATELGLTGHVGNDSTKVFIEANGTGTDIDRFVYRLRNEAPPLAQIATVSRTRLATPQVPIGKEFTIVESEVVEGAPTLVPPDSAICDDCLGELNDPKDRRYRHPFITCTNCGPRFTIIESMPYDRDNTTMVGFEMCDACRCEYRDPKDRRYHAQPIGCHDCGPTLTQLTIDDAAALLRSGAVIAIKGIGGYHLACDATNDAAVASLRSRKHRADKPFAVMVGDLEQATRLATITPAEADLLTSSQAPIVLLIARDDTPLSPLVAPGNPLIGVMVAYTPMHHLLFGACSVPLVMTSANRSGEPLAYDASTLADLDDLFDAVLDHDRPIQTPCDDSVLRMVGSRLLPIRRARGYAPIPVRLAEPARSVLAVGGELKNTFCLAADGQAWISPHVGDMENLKTLDTFAAGVTRFRDMYDVSPDVVAVDAHPGYLSSSWARNNHSRHQIREVQHHHAHVASIMAEHGCDPNEPILGFAFDGTGYGDDGTIWGGELLLANAHRGERLAHLLPMALPGGDAAINNPSRVALSYLRQANIEWRSNLAPVAVTPNVELRLLAQQLERDVACTPCSSMGRLFDAVASLLGLRHRVSYEAQAAIELEILAQRSPPAKQDSRRYRFGLDASTIDPTPILVDIVEDLAADHPVGLIAWRFHDAVADAVLCLTTRYASRVTAPRVALSGGVFQNALLTQLCIDRLEAGGFDALTHSIVPPNDGGLALGQAFIAAHQEKN